MILCSKDCIPYCDFCIYCIHEKIFYNGEMINGEPIGCSKHTDIKHQEDVKNCRCCDDFHYFKLKVIARSNKKINTLIKNIEGW